MLLLRDRQQKVTTKTFFIIYLRYLPSEKSKKSFKKNCKIRIKDIN